MSVLAPLAPLRAHAGRRLTEGLDDATIARLAVSHPDLQQAIHAAAAEYALVRDDAADLLDLDEEAQIGAVQEGFINFYADDAVTPYVA
ncbi:lysine 6-aminotransferase, partial [Xanthomonas perforans]|nr:lysine 6-aminotransferase [Xanthomonas perforans]